MHKIGNTRCDVRLGEPQKRESIEKLNVSIKEIHVQQHFLIFDQRQKATLIVSKGIIPNKIKRILYARRSYSFFIYCMDAVCAVYNCSGFSKV